MKTGPKWSRHVQTEASNFLSRDNVRYSLLVFAVAVVLRVIPEILAGRYPVGFDVTAAYPLIITTFPSERLVTMLGQAPLFYALMWSVYSVTKIDIYTILKV